MTEAEWFACSDPLRLLEVPRGQISDRKLRLFAVGCCQRIRPMLIDERSRTAIEVAAMIADGRLTDRVTQQNAFTGAKNVINNYADLFSIPHSADVARRSGLRFAAEAAAWAVADEEAIDVAVEVAIKVQGAKCWSVVLDDEAQVAEDRVFADAERNGYFGEIRLQPSRQNAQEIEKAGQAALLREFLTLSLILKE